jgi:hypothetical protein
MIRHGRKKPLEGARARKGNAMSSHSERATGRCLCGAVSYEVSGPLRQVIACHCEQCRRTSGHFVAATQARREDFRLTVEEGLRWYASSEEAERGFCKICGSSLFWRQHAEPFVSIMAGTLDQPTGLGIVEHIHRESAGDYYEIPGTR